MFLCFLHSCGRDAAWTSPSTCVCVIFHSHHLSGVPCPYPHAIISTCMDLSHFDDASSPPDDRAPKHSGRRRSVPFTFISFISFIPVEERKEEEKRP